MYLLQFDGAADPNPGRASGAYVLFGPPVRDGDWLVRNVIEEGFTYLDRATNNEAEYTGLILGLEKALEHKVESIKIEGDSMLVVNQVQGLWRVKEPRLVKLHARAASLFGKFKQKSIAHIPRESNEDADRLSKEGLEAKCETHRHN
jgi:ribonuclease HI